MQTGLFIDKFKPSQLKGGKSLWLTTKPFEHYIKGMIFRFGKIWKWWFTLGDRGSGGRAKSSSSANCAPAGTVSEGRVPLYMWNLQWGLVAMASSSSRGNQSWESLATHNSTKRCVLLMMHLCETRFVDRTNTEAYQPFNCMSLRKKTRMAEEKIFQGHLENSSSGILWSTSGL